MHRSSQASCTQLLWSLLLQLHTADSWEFPDVLGKRLTNTVVLGLCFVGTGDHFFSPLSAKSLQLAEKKMLLQGVLSCGGRA